MKFGTLALTLFSADNGEVKFSVYSDGSVLINSGGDGANDGMLDLSPENIDLLSELSALAMEFGDSE